MRRHKSLYTTLLLFLFLFLFHPILGENSDVDSNALPAKKNSVAGILPTHLYIPVVNIDSAVEPVGVLTNGHMGVPADYNRVGILSPWTKPGENGNAVLAGHVDHRTGPAVFFYLKELKSGDQVEVSDTLGKKLIFTVKSVESFKTEEAPLQRIFGPTDRPHLNLVTCTGKYDRTTNQHEKRLVVFTELLN